MKKLLLILLCLPMIFSCGDKEKGTDNKEKLNNEVIENELFFLGTWIGNYSKESLRADGRAEFEMIWNKDKTGSMPGIGSSRIEFIWDTISHIDDFCYELEWEAYAFGKTTKKKNFLKFKNDTLYVSSNYSEMLNNDATGYVKKQ